jgi:hypothetical protein
MSKLILFTTADRAPTVQEAADIAAIESLSAQPYRVRVMCGKPIASITAATLSAAAVDKSLNDSANLFLKKGFLPGQVVSVRGFGGNAANNLQSKTIDEVTAGKMTFVGTGGDAIVDDAAGESVTIETVESALGTDGAPIVADYLAGTVPASYRDAEGPIYPIFDPADPPNAPTLPDGQTVLSDLEEVDLDTEGAVTFSVEEGEIVGAELTAATDAVVGNGDEVAIGAHAVTLAVAANAVTGATLTATKAIVANAQVIPITGGGSVTLTIAGNAITGAAYTAP